MPSIYLISCNNKPVYVGFTTTSLQQRWKSHCKAAKHGRKYILSNAIRKYGKQAFTITLIAEHTDEDFALNVLEPMYVAAYCTHVSQGGYNMTWGGDTNLGFIHNETTKYKLREMNSGCKNAFYGKTHSDETRRSMSKAKKGKPWSAARRAAYERSKS